MQAAQAKALVSPGVATPLAIAMKRGVSVNLSKQTKLLTIGQPSPY